MALAARQQVSPQLCKCLCAIAEWKQLLEGNESKNEGGCKSSQYYKNSGTCLISGENRVSAPERFSFDENSSGQNGEQQSSYLDFRCGVDKKALFEYIQINCPKELSKGRNSTITTPTTTNTTTEGTTITTKTELKEEEQQQHKNLKKKKNKNKKNKKIDSKKSLKNIEDWDPSTTTATIAATTNLNEEKEEEDGDKQLETKTAIPSIEKPTELEEIGENWKTVNVEGEEKRKNKVNQGGDEKEEADEEEKNEEKGRGTTSIKVTAAQADPPREEELHNKNENSGSSTTVDTSNDSVIATTITSTSITETIAASTTPTATTTVNNNSFLINSTLTILNNITETTEFNATLNYTEGGTRESLLNGNLFEYPAVGQCRFSALYQTVFNGARLLKRLLVDTPSQCLAACHYESCRSANLIQMEDKVVRKRFSLINKKIFSAKNM
ncbi:unnamed protein product [Meloidogyne enterolobii]|uniref:Uncharacterized protein n=1 Tax=Meloidogyne enterolobii TaxID=390850 RepID=A0ACB1AVP1_MELEN